MTTNELTPFEQYERSLEKRNYDVAAALRSLVPGCKYIVENNTYAGITWTDENEQPCPSEEAVISEMARLQQLWQNNLYQRQRAKEYPSIQAQLDMQYWDSINGTTNWADAVQAVKNKYPKP